MTLGLESESANGRHTEEVREKQGWGVETSRRGAEDSGEQWRRWEVQRPKLVSVHEINAVRDFLSSITY